MLKLEEYIANRKAEDGLNEFDTSQKMLNIRNCIDYIFEYFDQYLPDQGAEKRTVAENEKLQKYEKSLNEFSPETRQWLVGIYDTYGKHLNKHIVTFINSTEDFLFMSDEADFRSMSYDCYASLIKKHPYLKNQAEMLYRFIKEYHMKMTKAYMDTLPDISPKITKWVKDTLYKYNVNIPYALEYYANGFWENEDSWPARSRIKLEQPLLDKKYRYNYRRKSNLFNIDGLYSRLAHKPFIKGHKKQMEIIIMYFWLHSIEGDDDGYWQEYLLQCEEY